MYGLYIARVERELRDGKSWCTPVFRFDETFLADEPLWERGRGRSSTPAVSLSAAWRGAMLTHLNFAQTNGNMLPGE